MVESKIILTCKNCDTGVEECEKCHRTFDEDDYVDCEIFTGEDGWTTITHLCWKCKRGPET